MTQPLGIQGWMTPAMGDVLAGLARGRTTVVEIGSWKGLSTIALAEACAGYVYAIDTWEGDAGTGLVDDPLGLYHEFLYNVARFGLSAKVVPICQDSRTAWKLFESKPIDLLYIDGAHDYAQVAADLANWAPLVALDGVVCGDDFKHAGVSEAVAHCLTDGWRVRDAAGGRMFVAERRDK